MRILFNLPITLLAGLALIGCASANINPLVNNGAVENDVSFSSNGIALSGTLFTPAGKGPHPAIVFLHGSGPTTRAGARPYAESFAKLGFASLIFDKRGAGESQGAWITSSIDDLANDALSAVEFVKSQDNIDPERIGYWGVSQAGWVAPHAAAQSQDVSFMILISGGGATPRESEIYSYGEAFNRAGLTAEEKAEAFSVIDKYFHYLATGEGRDELIAMLDKSSDSRWGPIASIDKILPSDENRLNWQWVADFDPALSIETIDFPLLLLFGDADNNHPTDRAIQSWRNGLAKANNTKASIIVFPGAGHGIRMRNKSTGEGRAPFADGYMEAMTGWLWLNVLNHDSN